MTDTITDFMPLVDKFLKHWSDAETALGRAVVLNDNTTRDGLQDLKDALLAALAGNDAAENDRQGLVVRRDNARQDALPMARQVRKAIQGALPSSEEAGELPRAVPAFSADAQKQLATLRDIETVWTRVNALPAGSHPALVLPFTVQVDLSGTIETVTLARYSAAVASLAAAASGLETAEQALKRAQLERKQVTTQLKRVFVAYRKLIRGLFPRSSMVYQSLP